MYDLFFYFFIFLFISSCTGQKSQETIEHKIVSTIAKDQIALKSLQFKYDFKSDPTFIPLIKNPNVIAPEHTATHLLSNIDYQRVKNQDVATQAIVTHKKNLKRWDSLAPGFMNVPVNVVSRGNTITIGIDIGGLLQSSNAGKTWNYISYNSYSGITNNVLLDFDISPTDPQQIIIAARGGIYKTDDGGLHWEHVKSGLPEPQILTKSIYYGQIKFNADGSRIFSSIGTLWNYDSQRLPASIKSKHSMKEIYVSTDNGKSFSSYVLENSLFSNLKRIYAHPTNKDIIYFSFEDGGFYVTFNATSEKIFFKQINLPKGYFVRDMSIDPTNQEKLLLLLSSHKYKKSLLYVSNNCSNIDMKIEKFTTLPNRGKDMLSIGFNPNKLGQVVIGETQSKSIFLSNDGGKTFTSIDLPKKFLHNTLNDFYGNIDTVYFGKSSAYAIIASKVGLWISKDNFNSFEELTMTYHEGWLGNKGVGSPANINSLKITNNNVYFSAQDHGLWVSNGKNIKEWKTLTGTDSWDKFPTQKVPWGKYTWLHKVEKVFVSDDEKYIIFNTLKYKSKHTGFKKAKKFFRSHNRGGSWEDITSNFGQGDIFPSGNKIQKVLFNSKNSDEQWVLFTNELYYSKDGGNHYSKIQNILFPKFTDNSRFEYTDIAYDANKNILYLSVGNTDSNFHKTLSLNQTPAALYRSYDKGKTWNIFNIEQSSIKSLGVTENSNIIIATSKVGQQPALLLTIPFNSKKFEKKYIKLTYGDTLDEVQTCGMQITPIKTDGKNVLAYANINWLLSDQVMPQGPYLSRDNGETFEFIQYDLPQNFIWSADIKDGMILLGTTFGLMKYDMLN